MLASNLYYIFQEIFPNRFTHPQFVHQYLLYKKGTTAVLLIVGRQSFAVKLEHFEGHHGTSEGHHCKLPHCCRFFKPCITDTQYTCSSFQSLGEYLAYPINCQIFKKFNQIQAMMNNWKGRPLVTPSYWRIYSIVTTEICQSTYKHVGMKIHTSSSTALLWHLSSNFNCKQLHRSQTQSNTLVTTLNQRNKFYQFVRSTEYKGRSRGNRTILI